MTSLPTLDELAAEPARAATLPPEVARVSSVIGKGVNLECVEKLAWDLLGLLGLKGPTARDVLAKRPAHKAVEGAGNLLRG